MRQIDASHVIEYSEFIAATMDMNYSIREDNILTAFAAFDKGGLGTSSLAGHYCTDMHYAVGCITFPQLARIMGR